MQRIAIRRSARLTWLLIVAHAGAAALLWPLALAIWIKAAIVAAIVASLLFFLNQVALLTLPEAVIAVEIHEEGTMALQTRRGEWHECKLSGDSFVSDWLTILVLAQEHRRRARHVVVMPDNVDAGDFRRLRVWLRWAGHRAAKPGGEP
jgi:toxin CptA